MAEPGDTREEITVLPNPLICSVGGDAGHQWVRDGDAGHYCARCVRTIAAGAAAAFQRAADELAAQSRRRQPDAPTVELVERRVYEQQGAAFVWMPAAHEVRAASRAVAETLASVS